MGESGFEPEEYQITLARRPAPLECSAGKEVARGPRPITVEMVPGPAGFAPASRRRVSTPPRPRGPWVLVRRRRALWIAVELRCPVARGQRPCAPNEAGRAGENRTRDLEIR